jgi:Asp-tRNA(Asn)/Glu-tRNA(Gln) amidotransferase C subunit
MFILAFLALMNNSEPERQTWFSTLSAIMQKADRMAQMDNSKRQKNKRKREDAEYLTQA